MRPHSFHRSFCILASLALLLIVLAPLVSRWVVHETEKAPPHAEAMHDAPDQHASMDGHAHHHANGADSVQAGHGSADAAAHSMHHGHHPQPLVHADSPALPAPDPHADHEMGVDCDYCLIAARMLGLLVALLLVLLGWTPPYYRQPRLIQPAAQTCVGHLGARGPPLVA